MIGLRLVFYKGRLEKQTTVEMLIAMEQMKSDLGVPKGRELDEEVTCLSTDFQGRVSILRAIHEEAVQLEWAEPKPSLSDFTRTATDLSEQCTICQEKASDPRGLTAYGHTYCTDCLQGRVFACSPKSHTCPHCRQELFPEPSYRAIESDKDRQILLEIGHFEEVTWHLTVAEESMWFLDEELAFHRECAQAMARDVWPLPQQDVEEVD